MTNQNNPDDGTARKPVFAKLTPAMTKEKKVQNLRRALEKSGFTIHPSIKSASRGVAS